MSLYVLKVISGSWSLDVEVFVGKSSVGVSEGIGVLEEMISVRAAKGAGVFVEATWVFVSEGAACIVSPPAGIDGEAQLPRKIEAINKINKMIFGILTFHAP
jgi:hypothetical protein